MGLEFKAITTSGNKRGHIFESWWFINSKIPFFFFFFTFLHLYNWDESIQWHIITVHILSYKYVKTVYLKTDGILNSVN